MSTFRHSRFAVHYPFLLFRFYIVVLASSLFIGYCPDTSCQTVPAGILKYPWTGGMNSCQFGMIDLDCNGTDDLVIFDRHGNRAMTFLYAGSGGLTGYSYHPEYADLLPDLHDWVIFTDYNDDGKQDIFTYSLGGIRVFRNISEGTLQFKPVTNLLKSYYYSGYVGILVTPVDYPAITDIDGDGDLDLLTFFGLGSYVEFHRNLSVEKFGNTDSLDYKLTDLCWGNFKENEGSNRITLDITCPYKYNGIQGSGCGDRSPKHTGSTLLALDLDGNGVKDLVLGDVDFPGLISLINGGTRDSAHMVSQDTAFPSNTRPAGLYSFPVPSFIDIDHDGTRELILSSFDPAYYISENFKAAWYYENDGTDDAPVFRYVNDRLFLYEMIDAGTASYPAILDVTGDGLPDLLVSSYGYYDTSWYDQGILHSSFSSKILMYRNTGSMMNPLFTRETNDFAGISSLGLVGAYPAFGDVDGDGDTDMILGNQDGTLLFFRNIAGNGNIPVFDPPVFNYMEIDVGDFSAPQLYDLDKDQKPDLIIGEKGGNINYYRNTGSVPVPVFTFITDSLGHVNVTNYALSYDGYSTPWFFPDPSGSTALIVGCEEGKVHTYTNIDGNLSGKFTMADSLLAGITGAPLPAGWGWRTAAVTANLTGTDHPDLVVGNFSGGLNYYSCIIVPEVISSLNKKPGHPEGRIRIHPNPANQFICLENFPPPGTDEVKYQIITMLGKVVEEGTCKRQTRIDVSGLAEGIYVVRAGESVSKLLVLH